MSPPSLPPSVLPTPRAHPLKPGTAKESSFIEYVDRKLLDISGRYEKRFSVGATAHHKSPFEVSEAQEPSQAQGYEGFADLTADLDSVIDIVWVSGTPSLQTPYLLNVALAVCTYLPSFEFSPRRTFHLLHKLDVAFSSLLHGQNVETGDALPGFEGGRGKLTTTEKVRIRGLVERTRVAVVVAAGKDKSVDVRSRVTETDEYMTMDEDMSMGRSETETVDEHGRWEMDVARVYERTIVDLGAALDLFNARAWE